MPSVYNDDYLKKKLPFDSTSRISEKAFEL